MATTINKQKLLSAVLGCNKKADAEPMDLPVLEQFIFGLCRENATPEQADRAYRFLKDRFYDWNEIRVSHPREIEEAFEGMADAEARSERLIAFLQEIFETTYSFDLEAMQKKGLKQSAKQLARYQAANDYLVSWVVQRSLGGHAIPVDSASLRCARRLGLVDATQEGIEAARSSLEHLVPKAKGTQFSDAFGRIAVQMCHESEPNCPRCPLVSECSHAQENGLESAPAGSRRPKPR